jgi:hypothetical protein
LFKDDEIQVAKAAAEQDDDIEDSEKQDPNNLADQADSDDNDSFGNISP